MPVLQPASGGAEQRPDLCHRRNRPPFPQANPAPPIRTCPSDPHRIGQRWGLSRAEQLAVLAVAGLSLMMLLRSPNNRQADAAGVVEGERDDALPPIDRPPALVLLQQETPDESNKHAVARDILGTGLRACDEPPGSHCSGRDVRGWSGPAGSDPDIGPSASRTGPLSR